MSLAYDTAAKILSNSERWIADEGHEIIVIYKSDGGHFSIASINNSSPPFMNDTIDNTLWFPSIESAKRYAKKEMYVQSRFKKISSLRNHNE